MSVEEERPPLTVRSAASGHESAFRYSSRLADSTRMIDVDLARVIGLIAVVAGHVWPVGPFADVVFAWHVPLFFVLTGWLWSEGRPLRQEIRKRVETLLVPYAAWLVVIGAVFVVAVPKLEHRPVAWGWLVAAAHGGGIAGRPFTAFWFVTVLFFATILHRGAERLPRWLPWSLAGAGVCATYWIGAPLADTPLGIGLAVPCAIFILVGRRMRRLLGGVTRPLPVGLALVVLPESLVLLGIVRPLNLKHGDFGTPVLGLLAAVSVTGGILLLSRVLGARLPHPARTAVRALAACGLAVVLTHAVVLLELNTSDAGGITDLALALVLPWSVALALRRTALSRLLLGVPTTSSRGPAQGTARVVALRSD